MPPKKKIKEQSEVVLFCGLSNAGKTTILNIFTKGEVFKTAPTLGVSLSTLKHEDVNFRIFDLGGQRKFREEVTPLLPFADQIIFVVDSADREKYPDVKEEFRRILENTKKKLTPICVLRHKSDLDNIISKNKIINEFGLKNTLDRQWKVLSTSAVSLEGLLDLFKWIYEQAIGEPLEIKIDFKKEENISFYFPCPMKKEFDDGSTFCMNQDGFIETEVTSFGFNKEVNKMALEILPDLRKESLENSGKEICPDFCILLEDESILRCPVTSLQIETRGIKISQKRYSDAVVLSKIYGQKYGEDLCRECIYKILISPETILTDEDIEKFKNSNLI